MISDNEYIQKFLFEKADIKIFFNLKTHYEEVLETHPGNKSELQNLTHSIRAIIEKYECSQENFKKEEELYKYKCEKLEISKADLKLKRDLTKKNFQSLKELKNKVETINFDENTSKFKNNLTTFKNILFTMSIDKKNKILSLFGKFMEECLIKKKLIFSFFLSFLIINF